MANSVFKEILAKPKAPLPWEKQNTPAATPAAPTTPAPTTPAPTAPAKSTSFFKKLLTPPAVSNPAKPPSIVAQIAEKVNTPTVNNAVKTPPGTFFGPTVPPKTSPIISKDATKKVVPPVVDTPVVPPTPTPVPTPPAPVADSPFPLQPANSGNPYVDSQNQNINNLAAQENDQNSIYNADYNKSQLDYENAQKQLQAYEKESANLQGQIYGDSDIGRGVAEGRALAVANQRAQGLASYKSLFDTAAKKLEQANLGRQNLNTRQIAGQQGRQAVAASSLPGQQNISGNTVLYDPYNRSGNPSVADAVELGSDLATQTKQRKIVNDANVGIQQLDTAYATLKAESADQSLNSSGIPLLNSIMLKLEADTGGPGAVKYQQFRNTLQNYKQFYTNILKEIQGSEYLDVAAKDALLKAEGSIVSFIDDNGGGQ